MANNGDKTDKILHGIQLTLEEIRDLREESRKDRREIAAMLQKSLDQAAEDRREAAVDRRQWAADRRRDAEDRREMTQVLTGIRDALSALSNATVSLSRPTGENTDLLKRILKKNGK